MHFPPPPPPESSNNSPISSLLLALKSVLRFEDECWAGVSDLAKDLLRHMLEIDPKKRYTAQQCLDHPWLQDQLQQQAQDTQTIGLNLNRLKTYRAQTKLQEAVLSYMGSHLTTKKQRQELLQEFKSLDIDGKHPPPPGCPPLYIYTHRTHRVSLSPQPLSLI